MATVIERVDRLEDVLKEFVTSVGIEFNKLYNSQMRTEAEMRAFKEEMRQFREESRQETRVFKEEMRAFKEEMRVFKEEMRQENREMNRRWGELANRMGTLVEDLVAPSLPRIVREVLGQEILDFSVRRKRRLADGRQREFDALTITPEAVCLTSVKTTLRGAHVDAFLNEELPEFRGFFPEYQALPVIGLLASLRLEDNLLQYAERRGLIVLGVGDQIMEVKNSPGFVPRRY